MTTTNNGETMNTEQGQTAEAQCRFARGSIAPDVLDRIPENVLRAELDRIGPDACPARRAAISAVLVTHDAMRAEGEAADVRHAARVQTFSDGQRGVLLGWHR